MKSKITKIITILSFVLIATFVFSFTDEVSAGSVCKNKRMTIEQYKSFKNEGKVSASLRVDGLYAIATVRNDTDCLIPLTLDTYKMFDNILANQRRFARSTAVVGQNKTLNVRTKLPGCMAQIDLFLGTSGGQNPNNLGHASNLIAWLFDQNQGSSYTDARGNFCTQPKPLVVSCEADPSKIHQGGTIVWTVKATGGDGKGTYSYSWSGTDGLVGSTKSVAKVYNNYGSKKAIVTVISGSKTKRATCYAEVKRNISDLIVSCSSSPNTVNIDGTITWSTQVTGGTGNYTYSWSGTDGLSGNSSSVNKKYSTSGSKTATVNVVSGNKAGFATCSANVIDNPLPTLSVSCFANPNTINVGGNIAWSAQVSGGTGNYTYSWSGTDELSGSSNSINKTYSISGTKNAIVTVNSGNDSRTASCSASVVDTPLPPLSVNCSADPSVININQSITWRATVTGSGNYTYSWTGTDGLVGSSASITKYYHTAGTKNASLVVTSGSRTASASCSASVVEEQIPLTVSCSPSSSSVRVGNGVYWNASVSGGRGGYTYSWSGTDNLYGSGSSIYKNYQNAGSKSATVTVNSNNQTVSASCYLDVYDDYVPPTYLEGSCSANPYNSQVGSNMTWTASAYGGSSGSYSYYWTGTDGLNGYGSNVNKTYYTPGYKSASVTITSGGRSITRTCSTNVSQVLAYVQNDDLPTLNSVYISDIPYTGIEDNLQLLAFVSGLLGFSALLAFAFMRRKDNGIEVVTQSVSSQENNSKVDDKFIFDRVISDKQAFANVEDIAMNNKVILSSDAIETLVKSSRINCVDEKELANRVVNACRKGKSQGAGEWCTIGDEDVKKVI